MRVVPFATTTALWPELKAGAAHVLHLSGHGEPGRLILETDTGKPRPVTAAQLLDEAIPPGGMPPVISLAACHTAAPAGPESVSFAAELLAHGASVVIGTDTSVTDAYATRLFARVYTELARSARPDVVAAVADARRIVQRELAASTNERDTALAGWDEWGVVSVLAGAGSVTILDPTAGPTPGQEPGVEPVRDSYVDLLQREVGKFVGRRREQRTLPEALLAPAGVGVVLHGIGGIGKTTLAAELIQLIRQREPERLVAVTTGELSVDTVLARVADVLRPINLAGESGTVRQAVEYLTRVDEPWRHRWQVLRRYLLSRYQLLLVLDNFEDNLTDDPTGRCLRNADLAELLAAWVRDCAMSRVVITSRFAFTLPEHAERGLLSAPIGPMSLAETLKLVWSLPALDRLPDADLQRVWRLVGGHPRTLEYLDALLAGGRARFDDVTERMSAAVHDRFGGDAARVLASSTRLDAALGVTLTLAADDVLLPRLLESIQDVPDARRLLLGLAVYREPVDTAAALFQIGEPDPTAAHTPNYRALDTGITEILTAAGVPTDTPWEQVPAPLREQLAPLVAELSHVPTPPVRVRADLEQLLGVLRETSLLTTDRDSGALFRASVDRDRTGPPRP